MPGTVEAGIQNNMNENMWNILYKGISTQVFFLKLRDIKQCNLLRIGSMCTVI